MGHWNFNRTYFYSGVDGFSTQDTATAWRFICNDDTMNKRVQEWVEANTQTMTREPGMGFSSLRNWLAGHDWQKWTCWTSDRKRNIAVDWGEISHLILSQQEMWNK